MYLFFGIQSPNTSPITPFGKRPRETINSECTISGRPIPWVREAGITSQEDGLSEGAQMKDKQTNDSDDRWSTVEESHAHTVGVSTCICLCSCCVVLQKFSNDFQCLISQLGAQFLQSSHL